MGALHNASSPRIVAGTVELAVTSDTRRRGLLGRDGLAAGHALLIAPCSSIHTWFMRFPIDVIFVRRDGLVLKTRAAIPAWRMAFGWGAFAVVELRGRGRGGVGRLAREIGSSSCSDQAVTDLRRSIVRASISSAQT